MQASSAWEPPGGTLGRILEETRQRVTSLEAHARAGDSATTVATRGGAADWPAALRRPNVTVIAEVKRRSPSKGVLNDSLDPAAVAKAFEAGGAAAISVLTEPAHFGGSLEDMLAVCKATKVPVLRKDFHIDRLQLIEARMGRASAALLIARALPQSKLVELMAAAKECNLAAIIEVRDEVEMERALAAGAQIVGVNSRNLETLEVDETVPERIMPRLPPDIIGVWESGVHDEAAVQRAAAAGADAVLVGSALSRSSNPEALVRSLSGVPRQARS